MSATFQVGDQLSIHQLLAFNPRWNAEDRGVIEEEIASTGGVRFTVSRHGAMEIIDVATASGLIVMYVGKGTIWFTRSYRPDRACVETYDDSNFLLRLSTHRPFAGRRPTQEPVVTLCDRCKIYETSVSGECPGCD